MYTYVYTYTYTYTYIKHSSYTKRTNMCFVQYVSCMFYVCMMYLLSALTSKKNAAHTRHLQKFLVFARFCVFNRVRLIQRHYLEFEFFLIQCIQNIYTYIYVVKIFLSGCVLSTKYTHTYM